MFCFCQLLFLFVSRIFVIFLLFFGGFFRYFFRSSCPFFFFFCCWCFCHCFFMLSIFVVLGFSNVDIFLEWLFFVCVFFVLFYSSFGCWFWFACGHKPTHFHEAHYYRGHDSFSQSSFFPKCELVSKNNAEILYNM